MLLYVKTPKEKLATAGTVLTLLLFAWLALINALSGGYSLVMTAFLAIISILVVRGSKFGYKAGKFFVGLCAVSGIGGTLNWMNYDDIMAATGDEAVFYHSVYRGCILTVVMVLCFYCLQEHAKLRFGVPTQET